jgi:hypothetical protein
MSVALTGRQYLIAAQKNEIRRQLAELAVVGAEAVITLVDSGLASNTGLYGCNVGTVLTRSF